MTAHCHAQDDGYCDWPACPQIRDGEPTRSARTCPLADFHGFTPEQFNAGLTVPACEETK